MRRGGPFVIVFFTCTRVPSKLKPCLREGDAHHGRDAAAEARRHQIRGREGLAAAVIVDRGRP